MTHSDIGIKSKQKAAWYMSIAVAALELIGLVTVVAGLSQSKPLPFIIGRHNYTEVEHKVDDGH